MLKTIAILQARTGSARLPQKVLKKLQGIPLLAHCIRRLKRISPDVIVVVATGDLKQNDPIEGIALAESVPFVRGSENDVLDRFYQTALHFNAHFIIRATGDNPLVDPYEGRRVLDEILTGNWDYVSGFSDVDGFSLPKGVGVEAFTFDALKYAWEHGTKHEHFEHINDYFFDNYGQFKIKYLHCNPEYSCPDLSLTVDTPDEFLFMQDLSKRFKTPLVDLDVQDVIQYWRNK